MRPIRFSRSILLCALVLAAAACTRGVAVESEPGPAYTIEVHNPMPHAMVVSYNDGSGTRLLGTVGANGHQRFVVTAPARQQVTVTATDEDKTHTVTKQVTLRTDAAASVTLNP